MSLIKSEIIEKNRYELQISVDSATFNAAVSAVYRKQAKNITVPGFRKGKAPRAIIEKMYGAGVFYEDAINDLIPEAYTKAIEEAKMSVDKPTLIEVKTTIGEYSKYAGTNIVHGPCFPNHHNLIYLKICMANLLEKTYHY